VLAAQLAAPKGGSASLSGAFRASRAEAESCWKCKNCCLCLKKSLPIHWYSNLDAARWYTHVLHLIFFSKLIYNVGSCWFRLQLVFSKLYGTISIIYTYINVNHCNLIVILQVISHISHISLIYLLYISYISLISYISHISHVDILSPIPLRIFLNAYAACARPCWKAGALWCPEIWRLRNWHFCLRIFNVITCFNMS